MAVDHKQRQQTIIVEPETTLAGILDQAVDNPVVLERNGIRSHVERDPLTPAKPWDPEKFQEALQELGKAFADAGIDTVQLKRDIRYMRGHDDDSAE